MRKRARFYILRLFIQRGLGVFLYLLGAGWTMRLRSLVYFAMYFFVAAVSSVAMYWISPETLAERGKVNTDSPKWDKALLGVYWLLSFFAIYLLAGLEAATAPEIGAIFWVGAAFQLAAAALSLYALMVNPFLESTARIQRDREQTVCKAGPYRIVRHPTYASVLLWCASVSMMFETRLVILAALAVAIVIVVRTALEDAMLKKQLAGYAEYAREVRYRLVPFIW